MILLALFEHEMTAVHEASDLLSGRYRVESCIGSGGMGTIYAAQDLQSGERVAVKLLDNVARDDQVAVERFRREAEVASRLDHPGILRVRDWGEADGTPYLVMDYADGPDLKRLLATRGPLPESEALEITADVCRALDFAHQYGVVHRDVKAHNVVLGADGHARLTDFGIAQIAGAPQVTDTGTVLGSAHYLSPEQARGGPLDARTDVYSLGVVLYELLTGRLPFDGASLVAIAMQHLQAEPPSLRELAPDLSSEAEKIVMRAIAKDPAQRFQSAGEMADALDRALGRTLTVDLANAQTQIVITRRGIASQTPVPASGGTHRPRRPSTWPPAAWILVAAALLVLVGGVLAWSQLRANAIEVPDIVGLTEEEAKAALQQSGLILRVDGREHSQGTPAGIVLGQQPPARAAAERGDTVGVALSLGVAPLTGGGPTVGTASAPQQATPAAGSGGTASPPTPLPTARPVQPAQQPQPAVAPPANTRERDDRVRDEGRGRGNDRARDDDRGRGNGRGRD